MAYDLVIKNGLIVDGSGIPGFAGDLAIRGDRIAAVGKVDEPARRTGDADGLGVALGLSINRNPRHRREDGSPLPSHFADEQETYALAAEVARHNTGIIQTLGGPAGPTQAADVDWYGELALATRRPVTWQSLRYRPEDPS